MRVVVAGSSGLIGTSLVSALRAAGHDVVRLVRRAPSAPDERGWDPPAGRIDDGRFDGADAGRFVSAVKARLEEGAFESDLGL